MMLKQYSLIEVRDVYHKDNNIYAKDDLKKLIQLSHILTQLDEPEEIADVVFSFKGGPLTQLGGGDWEQLMTLRNPSYSFGRFMQIMGQIRNQYDSYLEAMAKCDYRPTIADFGREMRYIAGALLGFGYDPMSAAYLDKEFEVEHKLPERFSKSKKIELIGWKAFFEFYKINTGTDLIRTCDPPKEGQNHLNFSDASIETFLPGYLKEGE